MFDKMADAIREVMDHAQLAGDDEQRLAEIAYKMDLLEAEIGAESDLRKRAFGRPASVGASSLLKAIDRAVE